MMFTSIEAWSRHTDPLPYRIVETGARVDTSAFGTPGVTIVFDPRPEFAAPSRLPVNEILVTVRDNYTTDTWASSMIWLTAVAGWVEKIYGAVPKEWRTDLPYQRIGTELLDELADETKTAEFLAMLIHAGNVLQRLADASEAAGMSYPLERSHVE